MKPVVAVLAVERDGGSASSTDGSSWAIRRVPGYETLHGSSKWRPSMKPIFPVSIAAVLAACPLCPKCGGALYRVPPRFVDRLFSPGRYRFQCESQECYWIGNLPIEGTNSTRFGLFHGLIAGSIVVIVASVALGLFGLFTIHRERAEVAATHNQSPSTTPSVMIVDDPQRPRRRSPLTLATSSGLTCVLAC